MAFLLYFFTEIYCNYIVFVQKDRFAFYCEITKPSSLACKRIERKPFIVHHLWMTRLVDFSLHCCTLNKAFKQCSADKVWMRSHALMDLGVVISKFTVTTANRTGAICQFCVQHRRYSSWFLIIREHNEVGHFSIIFETVLIPLWRQRTDRKIANRSIFGKGQFAVLPSTTSNRKLIRVIL